MKVLKFGGSSVANAGRISNVISILRRYIAHREPFAVVVSAMGGLTDQLIKMSKMAAQRNGDYKPLLTNFIERHEEAAGLLISKDRLALVMAEFTTRQAELQDLLRGVYLLRELSAKTLDHILSFGERNAAYLLSQALISAGISAEYLDTSMVVSTDDRFGNARVDKKRTYSQISEYFLYHPEIQIITGFIGSTAMGERTTLGRGGSDYTASLFGAALHAQAIEIWTDVAGVMTADPNKVKKALPVPSLSYMEALEMSHFGAKVIYPATIIPAMEKRIPILVKSTFAPEELGTIVTEFPNLTKQPVKGIASIDNVTLVTIQGSIFLESIAANSARLFSALARLEIDLLLITQGSSQHDICFAVKPSDAIRAQRALEEEFELELKAGYLEPIRIEPEVSVLAVVGDYMKSHPGISARLFTALGKNGINVIVTSQGSSERNISVAISRRDEVKALNAVHEAFFLSETYSLNLFIVGVGQVGSALLKQIYEHADFLRLTQHVEFNIVALANSKHMVFNPEGIPLSGWREAINDAEEKMDMEVFAARMISLNMRNSIFVDNTADANIANYYERILDASISISTPNKMAPSGQFRSYQDLKELAYERGVKFLYETNVGAGLPVITTISDLINSGDAILKIEGVLSGSLSFIFNTFDASRRFSDVVKEARSKGYTEPDPREDLSGMDFARKLTILARESGYAMEREAVQVIPLIPEDCFAAQSVEEFFFRLEQHDEEFERLRREAAEEGKVLRCIGSMDSTGAQIGLQKVDSSNPFFNLSGSDNMIVFTTSRYKERPLVIKGPGAGAEVTAAGVFAEIIRIGYYLS